MKILLVGNYDKDQQYSMQKFSSCLLAGLEHEKYDVKLIKPPIIFGSFHKSTVSGLAKWLGYFDKYLIFPFILSVKVKSVDIIHICDHSNSIYVPFIKRHPHIITCHDMMAVRSALDEFLIHNQVGKTGKTQQHFILLGLKKADHIATVSNATKVDLIQLTKQNTDKIKIIYNGLNYPFKVLTKTDCLTHLKKYNITSDVAYLLHVGGNQWYKNRKGVVLIYNELLKLSPTSNLKLILAGKEITKDLIDLIKNLELSNHVITIPDPSTLELNALYSLAEALVFPSFCEGFGWPIIEAQASGTVVFTSNVEPMTEIGGDAAIYFDPHSPSEAASIIANTIFNPDKINKQLELNKINIERFTTKSMIHNYINFYQSIFSEHNY